MSDKPKDISRREALQKLRTLTAYTAPTVVSLLMAEKSYAQVSNPCGAWGDQDPPGADRGYDVPFTSMGGDSTRDC